MICSGVMLSRCLCVCLDGLSLLIIEAIAGSYILLRVSTAPLKAIWVSRTAVLT